LIVAGFLQSSNLHGVFRFDISFQDNTLSQYRAYDAVGRSLFEGHVFLPFEDRIWLLGGESDSLKDSKKTFYIFVEPYTVAPGPELNEQHIYPIVQTLRSSADSCSGTSIIVGSFRKSQIDRRQVFSNRTERAIPYDVPHNPPSQIVEYLKAGDWDTVSLASVSATIGICSDFGALEGGSGTLTQDGMGVYIAGKSIDESNKKNVHELISRLHCRCSQFGLF
jgi:hypothetical protein